MAYARRFGAGLFALLLALSMVPALAQGSGDAYPDIGSLEGVEFAVGRIWTFDPAVLEATPVDTTSAEATPADMAGNPLAGLITPLTAFATVAEFDSEASAQAGYAQLRDIEVDDLPSLLGMGEPNEALEYQLEEVEGAGDQAFAIHANVTDEGFTSFVRYSFAQQGEYLFAVLAGGATPESADGGIAILAGLANQEGDHSGTGEFDAAGGSTGGLWEFFAGLDDEALSGLAVVGDEVLIPKTPA